MKRIRRDGEEN
jgi:predicted Rossmann fold nucleotide-binding protein DprA/Smf involved in DNA uptake